MKKLLDLFLILSQNSPHKQFDEKFLCNSSEILLTNRVTNRGKKITSFAEVLDKETSTVCQMSR